MDGFDDGLHGFVDVDDGVSRYLHWRAEDHFRAERREKRSIDSRTEHEAHSERVRERVRSSVGGLPDCPSDPSAETTGRIERDGYVVERVVFESRPNFRVTANCYVPDGDGPYPGILFCCGHVDSPKADWANQQACIDLVLNGFVVCIVDPIGQGERVQYGDVAVEGTTVSGGGGTFPHCYAGQKCFYAGANLARYVIHDARCALEYLAERTDVDEGRLGVTGASGGGTQAIYLALLDERIDVAAPCCAVTDHRDWMPTGRRLHGEQVFPGAIACGLNYDDLLGAIAPRPVCVGAAASDKYFPIEGVREVVDRVRRAYDRYAASDRVRLVVRDEPHCSVYDLRDGVFEWLCQRLGDAPYEPHGERPTLEESELHCTPTGSVLESYPDERSIEDLLRSYVAESAPDARTPPTDDGYADRLERTLVERFDLYREGCDLHPRVVDHGAENGLTLEYVWFKTERHPDVVVAGVLVTDPDATSESPAVVCYERGTAELPDRSEDVASLAEVHGAVFVFDPRGVGAIRNRAITVPAWWDDYYGIYGTEFKLATDALLLGDSLFGMRVYDVVRAVEFLRERTGAERASLVGEGIGAYHALYAAAVIESVDRLVLRDLGPSFYELATERDAPFYPQLTVFDVIGECDLPHLFASHERRGVQIEEESDDW